MSKVQNLDPQFNDPIEELRMLPDQLKLGQTSKVRFAIQKVLDFVESHEKSETQVVLKDVKKEDVLLVQLSYLLNQEQMAAKSKKLADEVGCKVVILNRGTEAKLLPEDTSVFKEKKNSHIVIKREDVLTLITAEEALALANILQKIEDQRYELGKKIRQSYYVVNLDEPYAKEVFEVIRRGEITKAQSKSE